jgi:16S rRNA C1402 (ribose-2'-O) methylase RsmI
LWEFYELSDEEDDDYFSNNNNNYGLFDEKLDRLKEKIKETKKKKGRGILISYYKYNEEERVLKLINGIKSGLKVVLVCDAGTPCISDPGYKLVSEAHD